MLMNVIDQAQQPFCFSLGTLVMNLAMIHFIMNDTKRTLPLIEWILLSN
jgi:hypothetical protein